MLVVKVVIRVRRGRPNRRFRRVVPLLLSLFSRGRVTVLLFVPGWRTIRLVVSSFLRRKRMKSLTLLIMLCCDCRRHRMKLGVVLSFLMVLLLFGLRWNIRSLIRKFVSLLLFIIMNLMNLWFRRLMRLIIRLLRRKRLIRPLPRIRRNLAGLINFMVLKWAVLLDRFFLPPGGLGMRRRKPNVIVLPLRVRGEKCLKFLNFVVAPVRVVSFTTFLSSQTRPANCDRYTVKGVTLAGNFRCVDWCS